MGGVGVALDYGREKAPQDVAESLDWLEHEGFEVVSERGGPGESFGNLLVVLERSPLAVRITRDRGQWSIELAPGRDEYAPLNVLLTAWDGRTPAPRRSQIGDPLPEVLPEGVEWHVVLPGVLSWLESGDRTREISEARAAWNAVMKQWWASLRRHP
jgi:hypothetical protein